MEKFVCICNACNLLITGDTVLVPRPKVAFRTVYEYVHCTVRLLITLTVYMYIYSAGNRKCKSRNLLNKKWTLKETTN